MRLKGKQAPGGRTGSWQPWIAMGSATRGIAVSAISPGLTEDSVLNTLPLEAA